MDEFGSVRRPVIIGSTVAFVGALAASLFKTFTAGKVAFDATLRGLSPDDVLRVVSGRTSGAVFVLAIILLTAAVSLVAGFVATYLNQDIPKSQLTIVGLVAVVSGLGFQLVMPGSLAVWAYPALALVPIPLSLAGSYLSGMQLNQIRTENLMPSNEEMMRRRRTVEHIERDRDVADQFAMVVSQRKQSDAPQQRSLMAERREKEKARAESTARMRAVAKAAFMSHPAATAIDFERCWPQIRDELFRQHTIQLVTESGENVDDLTAAIQKTSTQSVLRLASTEQSRRSLNLLSSGDPTAVPMDHSEASTAHHAIAVITAARDGNISGLRTLIEAGANLNLKNGEGWTALMTAALKGHFEAARLLVTAGASLEETNNSGWTALRFASSVGDLDMMRLLIDHGANLNAQDEKGWTILMQAADEGHLEAVKLLLAHDADKDIRSLSHESALSIALRQGHAEVVNTLKRNASTGLKQFAH